MKTLTILFLLLSGLNSSAQEILTVGKVFDYNIGDKFHLRKNNLPSNADRLLIIGKTYSINLDTVFYKIARNSYSSVFNLNTEPHLTYFVKNDTVQVNYTDLDSSIFTYYAYLQYDTIVKNHGMDFSFDTILTNSPDYCDRLVNGFHCTISHSADFEYAFGKGIGIIKEYVEFEESGGYPTIDKSMIYFNKAGIECGTPDTWTGVSENISVDFVKIYPNPVKQYLYFELNSPTNGTISLFDMKGALIKTVNASNNFEINVSDLTKGFYLINLKFEDKVINKKIMIQ